MDGWLHASRDFVPPARVILSGEQDLGRNLQNPRTEANATIQCQSVDSRWKPEVVRMWGFTGIQSAEGLPAAASPKEMILGNVLDQGLCRRDDLA